MLVLLLHNLSSDATTTVYATLDLGVMAAILSDVSPVTTLSEVLLLLLWLYGLWLMLLLICSLFLGVNAATLSDVSIITALSEVLLLLL
jgi:hypothetical protein